MRTFQKKIVFPSKKHISKGEHAFTLCAPLAVFFSFFLRNKLRRPPPFSYSLLLFCCPTLFCFLFIVHSLLPLSVNRD